MQSKENRFNLRKLDEANAIQRILGRELGWNKFVESDQLLLLNEEVLLELSHGSVDSEALGTKFSDAEDALVDILKDEKEFGTIEECKVGSKLGYRLTKAGRELIEQKEESLFF